MTERRRTVRSSAVRPDSARSDAAGPEIAGLEIASPANPRIRAVAALRDRRERIAAGRTLVDGAREIGRAITANAPLEEAFASPALVRTDEAKATLRALIEAGVPVTRVSERAFERLAFGDRSDGIVAVAPIPTTHLSDLVLPSDPLVVVLESLEKPGNLGAVLRTADGAGASAVVVADARTDPWNPNAIRASLGTIFSVPLAAAATHATLDWLRAAGLRVVAARVDATRTYTEADLSGPLAIVFGAEAEGLSSAWSGSEVETVGIPMRGIADSLNVSAAAAVLVYEARRQRDRRGRVG